MNFRGKLFELVGKQLDAQQVVDVDLLSRIIVVVELEEVHFAVLARSIDPDPQTPALPFDARLQMKADAATSLLERTDAVEVTPDVVVNVGRQIGDLFADLVERSFKQVSFRSS